MLSMSQTIVLFFTTMVPTAIIVPKSNVKSNSSEIGLIVEALISNGLK